MEKIVTLMQKLGIRATYQGYYYLCRALELCVKDENYVLYVWKWLYTDIAKFYGKSRPSVEHALRTVVSYCWYHGNRKFLDEIAGYPLQEKPSVGEFVAILYHYLKYS